MQSGVSTGPESSLVRFLPVGGLSGTLAGRYDSAPGLGNVAAKTGSLGAVATLAGVVSTANGTPMIFAVGADDVPDGAAAWYRGDLDAFVEALAKS